MGVTGLWKLIEPCGQPVPVELLENKILAVDISIWLHQVVKGFQDSRGSALPNAHLLGLFHRLCKLMYYRIKPVFVFDGKVPTLKRETIAKRNMSRSKLMNEADRIQTLLLQSLAKEKVVQQALGTKATEELLKASPSKSRAIQKRPDIDDIFKLPDLPPIKETSGESDLNTTTETTSCSESDTDSSFDETKPRPYYNENLQAIDVKSKYFRNLPADIRHEILIDIKETRKQSSWGKLHELPSKSNDFSSYQMKRLLKRRQVQESLEEAEKEMDGVRTFTLSELENIFSEEGIIEPSTLPNTKHISSDANTRFLLVRDLKKTLVAAVSDKENPEVKSETPGSAPIKCDSENDRNQSDLAEEYDEDLQRAIEASACSSTKSNSANDQKQPDMGDEYDDDLQKAIQLSLDESAMYSESDYEYTGRLKLTKDQRKNLKNSAVGLARAFMIEHAFLNDEQVRGLLEHTQHDDEFNYTLGLDDEKEYTEEETSTSEKLLPQPHTTEEKGESPSTSQGVELSSVKMLTTHNESPVKVEKSTVVEDEEIGPITDSSSDSELEEVCDKSSDSKTTSDRPNTQCNNTNLEILVDASKTLNRDNDLFADVFCSPIENKIELKPSTTNVTDILQDLKKQASEVTKINLTDIKLDPSIIEISDDESVHLSQKLVIDSDTDAFDESSSSAPKEMLQSQFAPIDKAAEKYPQSNQTDIPAESPETSKTNLNSEIKPESCEVIEIIDDSIKSPIHKTPSKTKSISEFYETKYVIKRTPEKITENVEDVPKVKSPFYVNRTPKSSNGKSKGKRSATDDEGSPVKKPNKASKMLFESSNDDDKDVTLLQDESDKVNTLEMAANVLKENKTREELEDLATTLAKEQVQLESERNRQDRMGMSITERMNSECMKLLRLFGIPFIVAPMEAEAQCAFLDSMQLTNGTITDDSDIWLFGGRTVYKNFFAQNKHVMEFKSDKIESSFNVDRKKLIQLALLVGSDYTTGINGIGAVTALEILASFSSTEAKDLQPTTVLATLRSFRDWLASTKTSVVIGNSIRHRLRNKLKNIELYEGFPSPAVVEAYLTPSIDNSQETFSWGSPDIESIREFTRTNFGWTRLKTDETLGPVLKKMNEKKSQSTITNYFAVKNSISNKNMPVSKRVQHAINKMSVDYKSDEEKDQPAKPKRAKRNKTAPSTSTSEEIPNKTKRVSKKKVNIPTSVDVIPQRQKNIEEMERKKELAAAVLKKSKATKK